MKNKNIETIKVKNGKWLLITSGWFIFSIITVSLFQNHFYQWIYEQFKDMVDFFSMKELITFADSIFIWIIILNSIVFIILFTIGLIRFIRYIKKRRLRIEKKEID